MSAFMALFRSLHIVLFPCLTLFCYRFVLQIFLSLTVSFLHSLSMCLCICLFLPCEFSQFCLTSIHLTKWSHIAAIFLTFFLEVHFSSWMCHSMSSLFHSIFSTQKRNWTWIVKHTVRREYIQRRLSSNQFDVAKFSASKHCDGAITSLWFPSLHRILSILRSPYCVNDSIDLLTSLIFCNWVRVIQLAIIFYHTQKWEFNCEFKSLNETIAKINFLENSEE